jgi:hypothetical protein
MFNTELINIKKVMFLLKAIATRLTIGMSKKNKRKISEIYSNNT